MKTALSIARSLCDGAGFDHQVVADMLLEAAVRRRMRLLGCNEADDYARRLAADAIEQTEILEELLVRESWFFRDQAPFALLAELAATRWRLDPAQPPLRILSAPCAGGEEPYSIAMALAGQGVPLDRFVIDAVDLSDRGLEHARAACYPRAITRFVPEHLARRYFEPREGERLEVVAELRQTVRFHKGNLLTLAEMLKGRTYQAAFSRNALIYLEADARRTVLEQLQRLLAADGVLFVGHVETALLSGHPLVPVGLPQAFAFAPRQAASARPISAATSAGATPAATARRKAAPAAAGSTPAPAAARELAQPPPPTAAELNRELVALRRLADQGRYEIALQGTRALLARVPDAADAHHLMGLILTAQGVNGEARRAFERALYLDPLNLPSLEHLALLLDAMGDRAHASRLRQRAARARVQHE